MCSDGDVPPTDPVHIPLARKFKGRLMVNVMLSRHTTLDTLRIGSFPHCLPNTNGSRECERCSAYSSFSVPQFNKREVTAHVFLLLLRHFLLITLRNAFLLTASVTRTETEEGIEMCSLLAPSVGLTIERLMFSVPTTLLFIT